jgi:hypothetical protein
MYVHLQPLKPYTLARFEPTMFRFVGGEDDY